MPLFLVLFPEVVIDSHNNPLQSFECQDVFITEPQLITDVIWDSVLYYLLEGPVISLDAILEFGKLNKIIDSFPII